MACFIFNVLLMELAVGITRLVLQGHVHQHSASSTRQGGAGWGGTGQKAAENGGHYAGEYSSGGDRLGHIYAVC